jgi:hypothetical protein
MRVNGIGAPIDLSEYISLPPIRVESGMDDGANETLTQLADSIQAGKSFLIAGGVVALLLFTVMGIKKARG